VSKTSVFSRPQRRLFIAGILLLFIPKLVNSYFLMPFPGSMDAETMQFSYRLDKVADFFLFLGGPVVAWGCLLLVIHGSIAKKAGGIMLFAASAAFYYLTLVQFSAEKMFREPEKVVFKKATLTDYAPDAYILGVIDNGTAKAYPLKYLAYHHKIYDTINDKEIMVTYCSMCRSGRIYRPFVEGENASFRLVGARHYNAVIEDSKTGTWWYQATGIAAAGPLRGQHLDEVPALQTTWKSWIEMHPATLLLQPDPSYLDKYEDWFSEFDKMRSPSDSIPENKKIWVAGISIGEHSAVYRFPDLLKYKIANDRIGTTPVVIAISSDSLTTHAWNRMVQNHELIFEMDTSWESMTDQPTHSRWNLAGECIEGTYSGTVLEPVQHYNEYLRSWMQFHPSSKVWMGKDH
jgi:hypothetical protein